ncbi:MAG: cation:proton antiporter [Bacteroidota bacterium]|nr:cation:proton antiporter [Candidatus Kapabacteria bacterium]MDW8219924.1 cation:proton antiporter [Bacteroidota bacterium]
MKQHHIFWLVACGLMLMQVVMLILTPLDSIAVAQDSIIANSSERSYTDHTNSNHAVQAQQHDSLDWILFVIIALTLGTAARHWGGKVPILRAFPFTVLLMLLGFILGLLDRIGVFVGVLSVFDAALQWAATIHPSLILFIFLPTLIFEAAFAIDVHTFKRSVVNALILAVPGMIIATVLTAASVMFVLHLPQWSWYLAFLFGALISATDPVAVVALLRELGASKKLSTLIDGESLLNDGVAIVIFTVFLEYVRIGASLDDLNVVILSQSFLKTALGGTLIGLVIAGCTIAWVRRVFNDALVEITVLVIAAYLTFYIAEHFLHVSGILGLLALGLVMSGVGRSRISPQVEHFLHNFWEMAAYLANTLIFVIVGVLIAERTVFSSQDVVNLVVLYIVIHVVRAVMLGLSYPIMKRFGYGITIKDAVILWWGALRGALGLCLCLVVMQESSIARVVQQQMMFYVAGIVFLTLTINATTIKWVIEWLGLTKISNARRAMLGNAMQELRKELERIIVRYKYKNAGRGVRWSAVREYVPEFHASERSLVECTDTETLAEIRLRLLEAERAFYQEQLHYGLISADSFNALTSGISLMMDEAGILPLSERPYLHKLWTTTEYMRTLSTFPLVGRLVHRRHAQHLSLVYDTAKACAEAQEFLYALVSHAELYDINQNDTFDDNEMHMARTLAAEIQSLRQCAEEVLSLIRQKYPRVALAAETVDAIRSTLNAELAVIEKLHHDGLLKLEEVGRLTRRVEMQMKAVINYPAMLPLPSAEELVRELPWLSCATEDELQVFMSMCEQYSAEGGTIITRQGETAHAMYIVLRGELWTDDGCSGTIGTTIGAYSAASGVPEVHTWRARSATEMLRVEASRLRTFLNSYQQLALSFWKWTSAEVVEQYFSEAGYIADDDEHLDWLLRSKVQEYEPHQTITLHESAAVLLLGTIRDDRGTVLNAPELVQAQSATAETKAVLFEYSLIEYKAELITNLP